MHRVAPPCRPRQDTITKMFSSANPILKAPYSPWVEYLAMITLVTNSKKVKASIPTKAIAAPFAIFSNELFICFALCHSQPFLNFSDFDLEGCYLLDNRDTLFKGIKLCIDSIKS